MSIQAIGQGEPIASGSDVPGVNPTADGNGARKVRRRQVTLDQMLQKRLVYYLLIVFLVVSGILYVTMSFTLLDLRAAIEPLQLPQEDQVLVDIRRIENFTMFAFVLASIGLAALAARGARRT